MDNGESLESEEGLLHTAQSVKSGPDAAWGGYISAQKVAPAKFLKNFQLCEVFSQKSCKRDFFKIFKSIFRYVQQWMQDSLEEVKERQHL